MDDNKTTPGHSGPGDVICRILNLERITPAHIAHLNKAEKKRLMALIDARLSELQGEEHDAFLEKVDAILGMQVKNKMWEHNHDLILQAVGSHMQEHGVMPGQNTVAGLTGLSLTTVYNHFKYDRRNPMYQQQFEQFELLATKMLARVFEEGTKGNMQAARLFFKILNNPAANGLGSSRAVMQGYIHKPPKPEAALLGVKDTVLSEETLQQLSPEQLAAIENIIKGAPDGLE